MIRNVLPCTQRRSYICKIVFDCSVEKEPIFISFQRASLFEGVVSSTPKSKLNILITYKKNGKETQKNLLKIFILSSPHCHKDFFFTPKLEDGIQGSKVHNFLPEKQHYKNSAFSLNFASTTLKSSQSVIKRYLQGSLLVEF